MQRPSSFVMDSYALIGFLENESFADRVERLLNRAKRGKCVLYLHAIHLGEVYYITMRERGQDLANLVYNRIKAFPVKLIEVIDEDLLLTASFLKASYPISYADSFAAAMAKIKKSTLLTGDPEFECLQKEGILEISWLS